MNQAIRSSWIVAIALFALVFGSITYVQFFAVDDLKSNANNKRALIQYFCDDRGSILVGGQAVAESVPSNDKCKYQRQYLQPKLYAGLTGFLTQAYGQTGIEAAENAQLTGNSDDAFYDRITQVLSGAQPKGRSVELTIDPEIQKMAFDMIPDGQIGSIVVMDPKTGAIIAMVSKPSYDTNLLASHDPATVAANYNRLVKIPGINMYGSKAYKELYSPGSVFKLVDTAAALASGKYNKDSVLDNPPVLDLPGTSVGLPNYAGGGCGARAKADFAFVLEQSCNTPFAQIALGLGQDAITEQATKFGFNQSGLHIPDSVTGSKFPGSKGQLSPADLARSAVGQQDVKATPLEIAMMTAAIANGGKQMAPNMIKSIRTPDLKPVEEFTPRFLRQSTTPQIAAQLTQWMTGVVDNGIAHAAAVPGVKVAGKTGTAEGNTADPLSKNNAWFTGFAPADNPKVVVSIMMADVDIATGAQLTSPNASKLIEAVLNK
ncbi:penicillin-binding protein 2 [Paenarthrobacter sp. Z7-10]|uniref:peptidoglycan D,D-transpeptidase FtsI family protein n=1 Tax=Paenarthrobacter sp. Z7-10 TaxID=2787635 RepID=UPI0022A8DB2A|nr:penicillin-binding protein 2 [Paenarthrobacter sp. Z7-10]MCZ2403619.1 penicillin-binding protein 2 [Paenarthrobacter sp. Z7-10]